MRGRAGVRRWASIAIVLVAAALGACTGTGQPVDETAEETPSPIPAEAHELPHRRLPPASDRVVQQAPIRLTASDGTGLRLVSLKVRAVVDEPLAFTELHLTFDNPEDRTLEGHFTIDLPPASAISRFAMRIDEQWQEGEVVERGAAQTTYEDFLHRRQDPALLENQAGNRFSARVFPIQPRGRKELILSYSQALPDSRAPFEVLLGGLPKLEQIDIDVQIEESIDPTSGTPNHPDHGYHLHERDHEPRGDLQLSRGGGNPVRGLRHGSLAVARVLVQGTPTPEDIDDLTILFDTSASRALDFDGQIRRLDQLVAALRGVHDFPLRVVAFDQAAAVVFEGRARDFGETQLSLLASRRALGASDLEGALRAIARGPASSRVLLMTDGIATAGASEASALGLAVRALGEIGVVRLDAIVDGGLRDHEALVALTTAGLAHDGVVVDARRKPIDIASKLRRATIPGIGVSVTNATFVWPLDLRGVQPGDEALVYAEIPADAGMTVVLEGASVVRTEVPLVDAEKALLERALAGAQIDALTHERSNLDDDDTAGRAQHQKAIVAASVRHRVLSDFTAMLVLETDEQYRQFGLDRDALSDVLVVGDHGVQTLRRSQPSQRSADAGVPAMKGPRDAIPQLARNGSPDGAALSSAMDEDVWGSLDGPEIGEAHSVVGMGLFGTGRGGGGPAEATSRPEPFIDGSSATRPRPRPLARVRQGTATVQGPLDHDILRRLVHSHINEVRYCYNAGLKRNWRLRGRVSIQFTIRPSGKVPVAVVTESDLADGRVAPCIARAVKRWRFPVSEDRTSTVIVTAPFLLDPGALQHMGSPADRGQHERLYEAWQRADALRTAEREAREREDIRTAGSPWYGPMFDTMALLRDGHLEDALDKAIAWRDESPADVLALIALGETLERLGRWGSAARVYGSLIDLFPARADLRRYAGNRLERLRIAGRTLAIDTYKKAVAARPDHPNSHRLYAWALVRDGRFDAAFDAILVGAARQYPDGRFRGVARILHEDAGMIGAALIASRPDAIGHRATIVARLAAIGATLATGPSTRFVMSWETDANDVDFHVTDKRGGHAYHAARTLASGGELYADVTTGYGPECFAIQGTPAAFPYHFEAKYFSRGPMGYGMGTMQLVEHDGGAGFRLDDRPFLIMKESAVVDLGSYARSLGEPSST